MAESVEVLMERLNGDMRLVRHDLKNYIRTQEQLVKAKKPEEDRSKSIEIMFRLAITGLLTLEGLSRAGIGTTDAPSPIGGALTILTMAIGVIG